MSEEGKPRNKWTTITVDREMFEMLERLKFLTLSPSYSRMFKKMQPLLEEFSLKYFTSMGDVMFKGEKVKPISLEPYDLSQRSTTED